MASESFPSLSPMLSGMWTVTSIFTPCFVCLVAVLLPGEYKITRPHDCRISRTHQAMVAMEWDSPGSHGEELPTGIPPALCLDVEVLSDHRRWTRRGAVVACPRQPGRVVIVSPS